MNVQLAAEAWVRQIVVGLGPLFALGALLFFVQRWTQSNLFKVIGRRGVVYWTGWLGTPIHELSHLVVGKLFGVRITEVKFFAPDERSGVLGYVRYIVPRFRLVELPQIIGTFLMGIAPLFGGALVLYAARRAFLNPADDAAFVGAAATFGRTLSQAPVSELIEGFGGLLEAGFRPLAERVDDPWLWAYVYVSLAVGIHLAPSGADLKGGLRGFVVLAILAFVANAMAVAAGTDPTVATLYLAQATAPAATLLSLALALNVGHGVAAFGLALVVRAVGLR